MVLTTVIVLICVCLLQDLTFTNCQIIREDRCEKNADVEDLGIKMKSVYMETMQATSELQEVKRDLSEMRERLAEVEKIYGKICKYNVYHCWSLSRSSKFFVLKSIVNVCSFVTFVLTERRLCHTIITSR